MHGAAEGREMKAALISVGARSGVVNLAHRQRPLASVAPGSCWEMKNYMGLIRLHYRTSDYMHLTLVRKKGKMRRGGGNIHDLINYVIMWICSGFDTLLTFEGESTGIILSIL